MKHRGMYRRDRLQNVCRVSKQHNADMRFGGRCIPCALKFLVVNLFVVVFYIL